MNFDALLVLLGVAAARSHFHLSHTWDNTLHWSFLMYAGIQRGLKVLGILGIVDLVVGSHEDILHCYFLTFGSLLWHFSLVLH